MRQSVRAVVINGDKMLAMHRNKFGREYYTLVGGGIDMGENALQALRRELAEETMMEVGNPRLVAIEDHDKFYGIQYVYWCDYIGGEPKLDQNSDEAKINRLGQNMYQPIWLPLDQLSSLPFKSPELKKALIEYLPKGFPSDPIKL